MFDDILSVALKTWLESKEDEFEDQDAAYEALNDLFQPVLDNSNIPL